jgi:hypothetical protein
LDSSPRIMALKVIYLKISPKFVFPDQTSALTSLLLNVQLFTKPLHSDI